MALELEDGTGLTESNAYVENDYVTDYHVARGGADNLAWTAATTLQKDNAIVRACTYLDIRFGRKFIGTKLTLEQAMEWPRAGAIDLDGFQYTDLYPIPDFLKRAVAEYAVRALTLRLLPDPLPYATQAETLNAAASFAVIGQVTSLREKVGPLEKETHYAGSVGNDWMLPVYPAADMWLTKILRSTDNARISR